MIYFVQPVDGGDIKIGHSRQLSRRVISLEAECKAKIRILGVCKGDRQQEQLLHQQFADSRLSGEWFSDTPELREYIRENAVEWTGEDDVPVTSLTLTLHKDVRAALQTLADRNGRYIHEELRAIVRDNLKRCGLWPGQEKPLPSIACYEPPPCGLPR